MLTETYPLILNEELFGSSVYENRRKSALTFMYVGENENSLHYFSSHFKSGVFVKGFNQARLALESIALASKENPDVVVIDIPLNKTQLESFCNFLSKRNRATRMPVIYNEKSLSPDEMTYLKKNALIDEITDIRSWGINFYKKVSFLKKVKNQHQALRLSKISVNGFDSGTLGRVFSFKRLFDIMIAGVGILILSPLFLLIALAIKLCCKGPVFYAAPRAGQGFKIFKFYKFRTMEVDADKKIDQVAHLNQYDECETGAKFLKICNDPRVTKVGKLLRNTSLDELPQLFNVLIGDMSIVGNRPLPIYEAVTLTTNEFVERFMAPAGITGLWQIKKRGKPTMSVEERIDLDISYARKSSLFFDMWIIAQTPLALLQKSNA